MCGPLCRHPGSGRARPRTGCIWPEQMRLRDLVTQTQTHTQTHNDFCDNQEDYKSESFFFYFNLSNERALTEGGSCICYVKLWVSETKAMFELKDDVWLWWILGNISQAANTQKAKTKQRKNIFFKDPTFIEYYYFLRLVKSSIFRDRNREATGEAQHLFAEMFMRDERKL